MTEDLKCISTIILIKPDKTMSIFTSVKRLFKHSAIYGLGYIFNRVIVFLLLPLHTNIFPKSAMGVANLVYVYIGMLTIVYTFGLDVAFFRFYMLEDAKKAKKRIFTTAFLTVVAAAVVFSGLLFFGAEQIGRLAFSEEVRDLSINLTRLIKLGSGILFFDALGFIPFLILRAEEKSVAFISYKFVNVLINLAFNLYFILYLKQGIDAIFRANLIASIATLLLLLPNALKYLDFSYSRATLKELFFFGIPYLPSTLSVWAMDSIDRIFLEHFKSVDAVGLYAQGAKLGMFMALFVAAFRFAWHPFFLATSKQKDAKQVFSKILTYVVLACGVVFLFFSLFIDDIVHISFGSFTILGKDYWSATVVVPVIFLAYIFYAAYLNFLIGIYLYKKTKYLPLVTITAMIGNLIANYMLIPHLGIMGAAWSRLIAYVIMATLLYFFARRLYPVDYEWGRLAKLVLVFGAIFFVGRMDIFSGSILLKSVLFLCVPIVLLLVGFFHRAEIDHFLSLAESVSFSRSRSK